MRRVVTVGSAQANHRVSADKGRTSRGVHILAT